MPAKRDCPFCPMNDGFSYLFDEVEEKAIKYRLPFNPRQNRKLLAVLEATDSGIQISHAPDKQSSGRLKVGFKLLGPRDAKGTCLVPSRWLESHIAVISSLTWTRGVALPLPSPINESVQNVKRK
ncbi:MAG: hypothetical protein KGZ50_00930 [Peptococcaceae bacterium]|nr:hypothetical protein [Peptococcaceae bacterium]